VCRVAFPALSTPFFGVSFADRSLSSLSRRVVCLFPFLLRLSRNSGGLYDRPAFSQDRVLLATGLVWRFVPLKCNDADVAAVVERMLAVEVYGGLPSVGEGALDYPLRTLLYESSSYSHRKKVHFADVVPATMTEVCGVAPVSAPITRVMLWNCLFVE